MNPAPTSTALFDADAASRSARPSAKLRRRRHPAASAPGIEGFFGTPPVAMSALSKASRSPVDRVTVFAAGSTAVTRRPVMSSIFWFAWNFGPRSGIHSGFALPVSRSFDRLGRS